MIGAKQPRSLKKINKHNRHYILLFCGCLSLEAFLGFLFHWGIRVR